MLRRRRLWLIALAAMCFAAASATAATDQGEQTQVAFQLRIGDVLPFTGDLAAYGANLDQAVKIAVALQNESLKRLKQTGISIEARRIRGRADPGERLGRGRHEARQGRQGRTS